MDTFQGVRSRESEVERLWNWALVIVAGVHYSTLALRYSLGTVS